MASYDSTPRTRVRRKRERGTHESEVIHSILDQAMICHVGFVDEGTPFVIPTIHARVGEVVYLHGSPGSRMLRIAGSGQEICITATLVDGLVLARSAMHHSMNYRSVVVLGRGRAITGREEKLAAMHAIVEHVAPGRWNESREPSESELAATAVVAVEIREASAKRRSGPPVDAEADYVLPHWAGVIPMQMMMGEPLPDPRLEGELPLPPSVEAMVEMQELGESSVSGRDGV